MGLLNRKVVVVGLLGLACTPEFESDLSLVEETRVLALAADPAEAAPGQSVSLTALIGAPEGTVAGELDWTFCLARRPLAELGPIAPECLGVADGDLVQSLGREVTVDMTIPADACRLFGPEPPPSVPGEPTGRPVDPDFTGGYYQPVLASLGEEDAPNLLQVRLVCGLAGATPEQAAEFTLRHQPNVAPRVIQFSAPDEVVVGDEVELIVSWEECPRDASCGDGLCSLDEEVECPSDCATNSGCAGAETHLYFDPLELELEVRREAISVAWYATGGSFDEARTGRGSGDDEVESRNRWRAPDESGTVHAWVVIRDDRGATGWASIDIPVGP